MTVEMPDNPDDTKVVQAYGDGGFRISGERFSHSIILLATRVLVWPVDSIESVDPASLAAISEAPEPIDILLIGCGHGAPRVDQAVRDALRPRGIVIDVMDTGAACRTYNLLVSDSRHVAAALIAV
jgi:uncharacterized protein